MTTLIPRNTTIPTKKSEIFSTAADSQTSVEVHVLQGERSMAKDNRPLGKFHLAEIPPAPRGVPQIEVTFDIDANGIVNVSAKDLGTGKEQKITITASSSLDKDEVDKMRQDAESHADEDKVRKEEVETRNKADQAVYAAERMIEDTGDKLTEADKQLLEQAVSDTKKASEGDDVAALVSALESLTAAQQKAAEAIYAQSAQEAQEPGGQDAGDAEDQSASGSDGEVIDAEVVEEDKK
jgi:molecular chaperone DnaK